MYMNEMTVMNILKYAQFDIVASIFDTIIFHTAVILDRCMKTLYLEKHYFRKPTTLVIMEQLPLKVSA